MPGSEYREYREGEGAASQPWAKYSGMQIFGCPQRPFGRRSRNCRCYDHRRHVDSITRQMGEACYSQLVEGSIVSHFLVSKVMLPKAHHETICGEWVSPSPGILYMKTSAA